MIGEIRDSETAELAFRAAQTGHFIISTLHTNDAVGAINRLKDLAVDANVCTSALLGVMAQRLIRQICWNCKQQYEPTRQLLESVFDVPPTVSPGIGAPAATSATTVATRDGSSSPSCGRRARRT